jgi:hypothetical protein
MKLDVVKFLQAWIALMKGFRGLMWNNLFVTSMVQIKYIWMFVSSLQYCSCMGRLNICQDGNFEYRFCFLGIFLSCISLIGGVPRRLGISTC